jgi:formate hydrogenlyase subunit 3/multisubunit Na+/H+ antiporter MnhD subunit
VWLLVGGGVGVAVGYLRVLNAMVGSPTNPSGADHGLKKWPTTVILVALGLFSVGLGLFPDPLLRVVEGLMAAYPLPPL